MSETQQGVVTVAESGSGPYSQLVHAGRHVLSADEPEASGGHDVGPSPYEYLLAGLGACTAMTLRSYVERHNWGLRRTTVELWRLRMASGCSTIFIAPFISTVISPKNRD